MIEYLKLLSFAQTKAVLNRSTYYVLLNKKNKSVVCNILNLSLLLNRGYNLIGYVDKNGYISVINNT